MDDKKDLNIRLRSLKASDGEELYNIFVSEGVYETTLAVPFYKYELSIEKTKALAMDKDSLSIVAIHTKKDGSEAIAGIMTLTIYQNMRIRHSGLIGIIISPGYLGNGIGSMLFEKILDISDNWIRLDRLELIYMDGNDRAKALYEKFGFVEEGRKRKAVSFNGILKDEIMMGRLREDNPKKG